ncbi:AAA family ATPase [Neolewinella agarilytica]|uniref:ATPase AAA-type core domain-containing protein n=1 Tax=Neolewinella agarilytica TaxID=478744 RepID=A0A1H9GC13_9BACT|nr:ATP-binding protein [Neolewinella agarilytica]SEQ47651.1 hypothetical protein SAMN05444359_110122 [Neolewinella agarilytica]
MLISFSLANFRSIKEKQTLSLVADALKEQFELLNENLLTDTGGVPLLRTKVLYGANSGGKTNVLLGLFTFLNLITASSLEADLTTVRPFLLTDYTAEEASEFEIVLSVEQKIFRYGLAATTTRVTKEWLYVRQGSGKESMAFTREGNNVKFGAKLRTQWSPLPTLVKDERRGLIRDRGLVLLQALNLSIPQAQKFRTELGKISVILGQGFPGALRARLMNTFKDPQVLLRIQGFLHGLGIDVEELRYLDKDSVLEIGVTNGEAKELITKLSEPTILFAHRSVDKQGKEIKPIAWPMEHGESLGTQKVFWLAAFIISAVENGEVLVVDEFEASLHPLLSEAIVDTFQNPQTNPAGGQLIIATHDTNLLSPGLLRRDQVAFVEKDSQGASELYSLSDLTGVRNDSTYEKDYLAGKYGSVPALDFPLLTPEKSE